ncbi:MAG: GatB/YqeY domain-containing protein [Alphaproteobacteria bacterium]|nr:GatB/YqeY domain-containing protein [Alphaproteobacteria bacterium]MCB9974556.1 GatB/YqeY domain-containing protein [Rhodospirillales bacterium]
MQKRIEINGALKEAMKRQDKLAVSTIRLIMAAVKDRDITAAGEGRSEGIEEAEILQLLSSMIKQRQESSRQYSEAGRDDLAEREEGEIEIIRGFLPRQLNESEVEELVETLVGEVQASGIKDMGKVMGILKERYAGQVDMAKASAIAKKKLA